MPPGCWWNRGYLILVFAIFRGVFAFLQTYWAERNSQSMAFDIRNDLYAKIQRLSFSYHDRNQTGQLMIRATDDIEKVRLFLGQGLLQLVGAILLIVATLAIMFSTESTIGAGDHLDTTCIAGPVHDLRYDQPTVVHQGTGETLKPEYHITRKPGWYQSSQGFYTARKVNKRNSKNLRQT